jgi:hypothetical protein
MHNEAANDPIRQPRSANGQLTLIKNIIIILLIHEKNDAREKVIEYQTNVW